MSLVNQIKDLLEQENVFLSGGAGVGKSYLTHEIIHLFKREKKEIAVLGSTAISAFNIGGVTLQSFLALGICKDLNELAAFDKRQKDKLKKLAKTISKLDLIIIDEISMVSADLFELFAFRLKSLGFKGKVLVVGDFCQLPPIKKEEKNEAQSLFQKAYYAFDSSAWSELKFKNVLLSKPKRTQNDEFVKNLLALRTNTLENARYFEQFLITQKEFERLDDDFTLLCGINKKVDFINESKLARIEGDIFHFKAQAQKLDASLDDRELARWVRSLSVLDELKLKIKAKVIFCVNNYDAGYYNGEQGIITDIVEDEQSPLIYVRKNNGEEIAVEPFKFELEDLIQESVKARLKQFPLKLAYAMTIHKSQGMSIENLACDIDHIFENAQLYVALSRASKPQHLKIIYSKAMPFNAYFLQMAKVDERALEFYAQSEFKDLEK